MEKLCTGCSIEKDINSFGKDKHHPTGYCSRCKSCQKDYREANKDKIKNYMDNRKPERKEYDSEYYKANKITKRAYKKKYYDNNKDKIIKQVVKYRRNRMKTDTLFRLWENVRRGITQSIKRNGYTKRSRTYQIVGCEYLEFIQHIESQWESWMTWDNYGLYNGAENYGWDIDHIIPQSLAESENELIRLNHYTNLQPLCSYINRDIKKASIW